MVRRAQCQCGGFTATAATEPRVVMACHCTWCQRRSGVPVTISAYFEKDDVRLEGDYKVFERPAPEGRKLYNYFCPTCGTTLAWRADLRPDVLAVAGVSPTRTSRRRWCRCGKRRCADGSSSPRERSTFLARDSARGNLFDKERVALIESTVGPFWG